MFIWKKRVKTKLEEARDEALIELHECTAGDDDYEKIIKHVKTLTKLIDLEKSEKLSPNTIAVILGNTVIALFVVGYESKNIVTTKVQTFIQKATK